MKTLKVSFNIIIEDDFYKEVMHYMDKTSVEDVDEHDVVCYLEDSMDKARTNSEYFMVEGGDTDGWFIQSVECA